MRRRRAGCYQLVRGALSDLERNVGPQLALEAMMAKLRSHTIQQWFADFTDALNDCRLDRNELAPVMADTAIWPFRPASNSNARYH